MMFSAMNCSLVLAALVGFAFAGKIYVLSDSIVGDGFYGAFNFEVIPDPTNGRVNYVDEATAQSLNLTYATYDTFIMRADDTAVLSSSDPGRNSVRIRSNAQYKTHVAVDAGEFYFTSQTGFGSCTSTGTQSTWPAVWETNGSDWPDGGEVDIVEGVNDMGPNQSTLHTSAGCSIPNSGVVQLGTTVSTNCNSEVDDNTGCGVQFTEDYNSFGPNFNSIGGGWYALERTDNYISVWFWERGDPSAPGDATVGAPIINTSGWGTPAAYFPNTDCDLASHFDANNIIIDLTFCGDWAGNPNDYVASGCPSDCVDYVNNNPTAFTDAYFQFTSINIYE